MADNKPILLDHDSLTLNTWFPPAVPNKVAGEDEQGVRASLTSDELEELRSCGCVADFAPAGALPVSDLVAGDLSVLAAEGRRLPAEHDALQRGERGIRHKVRNRVKRTKRCVAALWAGVYMSWLQ